MSGQGAGYSASGGAAGPSSSGLTSTSTFAIGGNAGIGSSQGINTNMIAIVAVAAVAAYFILKKK